MATPSSQSKKQTNSASGDHTNPKAPLKSQPELKLQERFQALKHLPKFFRMIWKCSPTMTLLNVCLRIIRASIPLAMLYMGKLIIDEVVLQMQAGEAQNLERLWWYVGIELGLAVVADILNRSVALLDSLLGDLFAHQTSVQLMEHATRLDLDHFEDSTFYDKLERARRQVSSRILLMSQVLGQAQDLITIGFLAVGLVAFNPWLILLLAVALIPAFLGEAHFHGQTYSLMYGWTEERRELDYLRFAGASNETAKEVKIFGLANFLTDRYRNLAFDYYRANRSLAIRRSAWGSGLSAVGNLGYYVAYVVIILNTVSGNLSLGDLTFLAGSFQRLRSLMEGILSRFSSVAESALYLRDLFDFFDIEPKIVSSENALSIPSPVQEGFTFEDVGFRYLNSERWALRHVSFTLKAGEKLALVGENGAGKTTLVKLLARLYEPTEGRILLDGRDLKEYDLADLRDRIGVIFQDFVRYYLTAGENIAVGRVEERHNQDRIESAAGQSLADAVIAKLPDRYSQVVGRWFRKGLDLSGGEWQKVALARAYMRDANLLILDEPTAALDARAEHEVFQRFVELTQGKTAVLISHRFSTVRMADRILVLDEGQLLEIGTHEELLSQAGRYSELFHLQAQGYR